MINHLQMDSALDIKHTLDSQLHLSLHPIESTYILEPKLSLINKILQIRNRIWQALIWPVWLQIWHLVCFLITVRSWFQLVMSRLLWILLSIPFYWFCSKLDQGCHFICEWTYLFSQCSLELGELSLSNKCFQCLEDQLEHIIV